MVFLYFDAHRAGVRIARDELFLCCALHGVDFLTDTGHGSWLGVRQTRQPRSLLEAAVGAVIGSATWMFSRAFSVLPNWLCDRSSMSADGRAEVFVKTVPTCFQCNTRFEWCLNPYPMVFKSHWIDAPRPSSCAHQQKQHTTSKHVTAYDGRLARLQRRFLPQGRTG